MKPVSPSTIDSIDGMSAAADLLAELVHRPAIKNSDPPPTMVIAVGELVAMHEGTPLVVVTTGRRDAGAVAARTTVGVKAEDIGKDVVLAIDADHSPIILGVLSASKGVTGDEPSPVHVLVDGDSLTVSARERLVLRCGRASITLTAAGKVLIEGTYVSSHAAGLNRIKGGSIQLN